MKQQYHGNVKATQPSRSNGKVPAYRKVRANDVAKAPSTLVMTSGIDSAVVESQKVAHLEKQQTGHGLPGKTHGKPKEKKTIMTVSTRFRDRGTSSNGKPHPNAKLAIRNAKPPTCAGQPEQETTGTVNRADPWERTIRFKRNWIIDEALAEVLSDRFPNHVFEQAKNNVIKHPHTLSAIERAITEAQAYEALVSEGCKHITDIGGNADRHLKCGRNVHSCCPILSPKDALRNTRYNSKHNFCTKISEECDIVPDGYMAIHSLYYLEPLTVLSLLMKSNKKIIIATMHDFTNGYGRMHFNGKEHETSYQLVSRTTVKMTALGNDGGPYTHSPCFWLQTNYFEHGSNAMAWGYREVGDTRIYTFKQAPTGLHQTKPQELDLITSIVNNQMDRSADGAYAPLLDFLKLRTTEVVNFGPLWWTKTSTTEVFVPKGIVQRVAYSMVGKPRNKDSLTLCIKNTKNELDPKKIMLPDSVRTELAIIVPAFAFILHLDSEISAFNNLVTPSSVRRYQSLNSALAMVPPVFSCFGTVFKPLVTSKLCCWSRSSRTTLEESSLATDEYNNDRTSTIVAKERIGHAYAFLSTKATAAAAKVCSTAWVRIVEEQDEKDDKPVLKQVTTTFSGHIPIVPTVCQSNTLLAITNRVVKDVPAPLAGAWDRVLEWEDKHQPLKFREFDYEQDDVIAFHKWNKNFPSGRAKQHVRAFEFLRGNQMTVRNYLRSLFMKREKLDKSTCEGLLDFTPRGISGTSHESNVCLGPYMSQFSKQFAKQWNGEGMFYYTAGATGHQVGDWMFRNHHMGDLIVDIDFSTYDCTQSKGTFKCTRRMHHNAGIDEFPLAAQSYDHQTDMHGFSNDGIEYRVREGRNSGDPNTSCDNTYATGITTAIVLHDVFCEQMDNKSNASTFMGQHETITTPIESGIKIAAMGDDNTSIIPSVYIDATFNEKQIKKDIVEGFAKFGFIAKVNLRWSVAKTEFCSAVFWPAKVNGTETYVLGPKPGRLLPKMGYSIRDLTPGEVKGMFIGYKNSCSHVPVLSTYVDSMLTKLSDVTEKHYTDREAQYKISLGANDATPSEHLGAFFAERYDLDLNSTVSSLKELLVDTSLDQMVDWPLLADLRAIDA